MNYLLKIPMTTFITKNKKFKNENNNHRLLFTFQASQSHCINFIAAHSQ